METINVFKGDSTVVKQISMNGYATLDGDWSGKKVVRPDITTAPVLDVALEKESGNAFFLGYLTPTETAALPVGSYLLIFEITNVSITPKFKRELHYKLRVKTEGAP